MKRYSGLNLVYPPMLVRFLRGAKRARAAGFNVHPFETVRSFERQQHLYAKGRTSPGPKRTNARAGRTWHHYGVAIDVCLKDEKGNWTWADEEAYVQMAPYFEKEGLYWAGRNKKFVELVHYQLPVEMSIYEVEIMYREKGDILDIWKAFNRRYGDKDLWKI